MIPSKRSHFEEGHIGSAARIQVGAENDKAIFGHGLLRFIKQDTNYSLTAHPRQERPPLFPQGPQSPPAQHQASSGQPGQPGQPSYPCRRCRSS